MAPRLQRKTKRCRSGALGAAFVVHEPRLSGEGVEGRGFGGANFNASEAGALDRKRRADDLPVMIDRVVAILPSILLAIAPAPSASPAPAAVLWTDDGTVLEVPLAHRDRDRIDAGVLRIDRRRRVLTWQGLPEEIGCRLRVEAPLDDVRGIAESRGAGLTLRLRSGPARELVLIPPAHFALLAQPIVRKRGGLSREEAIAGRLKSDDLYADAAGSGAFGGPTGKVVLVPEDVRRDVYAVVAILRSAAGIER